MHLIGAGTLMPLRMHMSKWHTQGLQTADATQSIRSARRHNISPFRDTQKGQRFWVKVGGM